MKRPVVDFIGGHPRGSLPREAKYYCGGTALRLGRGSAARFAAQQARVRRLLAGTFRVGVHLHWVLRAINISVEKNCGNVTNQLLRCGRTVITYTVPSDATSISAPYSFALYCR